MSSPDIVAFRLERLAEVVHPHDRGPYTDTEIVDAISAGDRISGKGRQPVAFTLADLTALRAGRPTAHIDKHLDALAGVYGVTPTYFTDDATAGEVDQELRLLELLRDTRVRWVGLCHGDQVSLQGMIALLEAAQRLEVERAAG